MERRRGYGSRGYSRRGRDGMPERRTRRRDQMEEDGMPGRPQNKKEQVLYCKVKLSNFPQEFSQDDVVRNMNAGGVVAYEHMFKTTRSGEKFAIFKYKSEDEAQQIVQKVNGIQVGDKTIEAKIIARRTQRGRGDRNYRNRGRRYGGRRDMRGGRRMRRGRDMEGRFDRRRIGGFGRHVGRRGEVFRSRFNMGSRSRGLRFNGLRRRNDIGRRRNVNRVNNRDRREDMNAKLSRYMSQE